jgi:uncharacterized C2H2 Zn-finger protein
MDNLICNKCGVSLKPAIVKIVYLDREMQTELMKCPICGQVFISEELVQGKIRHVEEALEDK